MNLSKNFSTILFTLFVVFTIGAGWHQRDEYWLTAEKGWGYALGIIGGSLMLVMLLYPMRKHWKLARNWFSIRHWFKMHMLLGIIGPLLILFHSNFHLGSLNSNIALFSMLLVSSSGVIGRFAYQKIHRGLYGEQIQFSELKQAYDKSKSHFELSEIFDQRSKEILKNIEVRVMQKKIPFFSAFICNRKLAKLQKKIKRKCRLEVKLYVGDKEKLKNFTQEARALLSGMNRLKRMTNYTLYARVFSLWHLFHLPLFFMMIIAGVVHVFAVHMY